MNAEFVFCPFCGETTSLSVRDVGDELHIAMAGVCGGCLAAGPPDDTEEQAIANWNRRPTSTLPVAPHLTIPVELVGYDVDKGVATWRHPGPAPDDLAAAREKRDLAGLPSLNVTTEPDGLSMDFDLGGEPKKR